MRSGHYIFIVFLLLNAFFTFSYSSTTILVNASFLLNFASLCIIGFLHLFKEKQFSPYISSFLIFSYLFFFIAPISQIISLPEKDFLQEKLFFNSFPNTFPFEAISVIKLNVIITFWNLLFYIFYLYFKNKSFKEIQKWNVSTNTKGVFPMAIIVVLCLSFFIIVSQYDFIINKIFFHGFGEEEISTSKLLILTKTLFSVPFIGLIMSVAYLRNTKKVSANTLIIFSSLILFLFLFLFVKNPAMEKRNALGPIFITLLLFSIPQFFRTNKRFFSFLFLSMIIVFPLISILTHAKVGVSVLLKNPKIYFQSFEKTDFLLEFNSLHYDAYANVLATMDYVTNNGIVYGKHFFSGLFFFIPRSIWESKPENTGQFIGQYLMKNYNMWFDNISNPFLSEGIINFGLLSIVLFPILLAWFIVKMLRWQYSNDLFKQVVAIYFSIHLIFFLRGDFTNGWAYFIGTAIGIYVIPKIIIFVLQKLPKKRIEI